MATEPALPDARPADPAATLTARGAAPVTLVTVGASTVAWALHDLAGAAIDAGQRHAASLPWLHDANWLRAVVFNAAVVGLAAWLIFSGHGVVDRVRRARTAGHPTDYSSAR